MNRIILFLIIASVFLSCKKDFITLNPPSNLNATSFYKTEEDMNQAVLSAYSNLRSLYNSNFIKLGEIRSDNTNFSWLAGNPANENGIDIFSAPLLPENGYLSSTWDNGYNIILRCNIVIGRIETVKFKSEQLKKQYIGEARFLRALVYFWLNRAFGGFSTSGDLLGVIKVDKEVSPTEAYELVRPPLQSMYDLIVEDLKYGEENLLIIRKEHEIFPLIWAVTGQERHVIYQTLSDCMVWRIGRDEFMSYIQKPGTPLSPLLDMTMEMYRIHSERIINLAYRSVRERLVSFLLTTSQRFGEKTDSGIIINVPLRHQDIASSINATRETTGRELAILERRGLISNSQHLIKLQDIKGLKKVLA